MDRFKQFLNSGKLPARGHEGHLQPVTRYILGDNERRPRPPPIDPSKVSKAYAFLRFFLAPMNLLSNERPPPASAQNMACSTASQKLQKHMTFEPFFNTPIKVALKWMGRNGALQLFFNFLSPLAWRARGPPKGPHPLYLRRARGNMIY